MATLERLVVPHETVNDEVVVVLRQYAAPGAAVRRGAPILEIETSKAAITLESSTDGYVRYRTQPGANVAVGTVLAEILDNAEDAARAEVEPAAAPAPAQAEPVFSRPALAALERLGIDRAVFRGRANISAKDVEAHAASVPSAAAGEVERVPLSPAKLSEIRVLGGGAGAYASAVTATLDTRGIFERTNAELAVLRFALLPLLVHDTARLLRAYPDLNAYFDDGAVARYRRVDVGIAIDLGAGLRVVRVPDADRAGLSQIEDAILSAVEKYEANTLRPEDLSGATFTITDLSADGVTSFVPLVPARTSAILGVGAIDRAGGAAALTLAFDHRVSAARPVAAFLRELIAALSARRTMPPTASAAAPPAPSCTFCFKSAAEDRALGGRGFVPLVEHDGSQVLVCGICLAGY